MEATKVAAHAPGPYAIKHDALLSRTFITSGKDEPRCVADVMVMGHAEFIVRACNAHDDLLAALTELVAWATDISDDKGVFMSDRKPLNIARAAIAKAQLV